MDKKREHVSFPTAPFESLSSLHYEVPFSGKNSMSYHKHRTFIFRKISFPQNHPFSITALYALTLI